MKTIILIISLCALSACIPPAQPTMTTWDDAGTAHIILCSDVFDLEAVGDSCMIYTDGLVIASVEPCGAIKEKANR